MQDEILLRQWTAGHRQFSADLDRLIGKILTWLSRRARSLQSIGSAYADHRRPARPQTPAASTLASGLAAVATTVTLFATVAMLATPDAAAGLSRQSSTVLVATYELA